MPFEEKRREIDEWDHQAFTQAIVRMVRGYHVPLEKLPKKINLAGLLDDRCQKLIDATLADPQRKERAMSAIVPVDRDVLLVSNEIVVGDEKLVSAKINLRVRKTLLGSQYDSYDYPAFTIHTHGVADVPPSPTDLQGMLDNSDGFSTTAEFVVTPTLRFLLLKSLQTPDFSTAETRQETEKWKSDVARETRQESDLFRAHMKQYGGVAQHQLDAMEARIQLKHLVEKCDTYQIALYVASKNSKFARYSGH